MTCDMSAELGDLDSYNENIIRELAEQCQQVSENLSAAK